jgi:3-hydroxymyristoyl/3-hydroxydecanoyl-(acyl carrier protein) dehydratase
MPTEAARAAFEKVTIADGVARAVVRRTHAEALCEGHFPGDPFVPGAYLAGLMADVARHVLLAERGDEPHFAEVEDCTFHAPVVPDDAILVEARVLATGPEGWRVAAEVHAGGARAARGVLRFAAVE